VSSREVKGREGKEIGEGRERGGDWEQSRERVTKMS
jgi:hypothetical protein